MTYTRPNHSCGSRIIRPALCALLLLVVAHDANAEAGGKVTYADLAPIINTRCLMCHSGDAAPLALRLDSFDSIMSGSARGAVVKAGDPGGSELIRRIKGLSLPRMPMTGPPFLSEGEIVLFERWVADGFPRGDEVGVAGAEPAVPPAPQPGERVTYAHVAPTFAMRCAKCHTEEGLMGPAPEGYRLTSYDATLATHDRVRVVPGQPEASELLRRIRGDALPRMPFDGPPYLTEEAIRLVEAWIAQGARNAEGVAAVPPAGARVRLHGTSARAGNWTDSRLRSGRIPASTRNRRRETMSRCGVVSARAAPSRWSG